MLCLILPGFHGLRIPTIYPTDAFQNVIIHIQALQRLVYDSWQARTTLTGVQAPVASTSKRRNSSSPSRDKAIQRPRITAPQVTGDALRDLTPPPTEHAKNSSAGGIEKLSQTCVDAWRWVIQNHEMVSNTTAFMKAANSNLLAENLISALRHLCQKNPPEFIPVEGVQSRIPTEFSLMCLFPQFEMLVFVLFSSLTAT